MHRLELKADLLTHHDVIDSQHAVLVDLLNEATLLAETAASLDGFARVTDQLLDYARYHFETEERLMEETGYAARAPAAARLHLAEHGGFTAHVLAMRSGFAGAPRQVDSQQLARFLQDWLVHHIGESDRELGRFLLGK
jgi:hemerythrin-like metal-binding protein